MTIGNTTFKQSPAAKWTSPRASRVIIPGLPTGRIKEGRRLQRFRAGLVAHVGGVPTRVQAALIDRATMLQCHISRMDAKALLEGGMSQHATREYLAWSNTLTRTLRTLGLEAAPPPKQRWQPYAPPVAPNAAPRATDASA